MSGSQTKPPLDIDGMLLTPELWDKMSEEQLIDLLTKPELSTRNVELKLRAVCSWVDGGKAYNQLRERLGRFRQLLDFVDLASITERSFLDVILSDYAILESRPHR